MASCWESWLFVQFPCALNLLQFVSTRSILICLISFCAIWWFICIAICTSYAFPRRIANLTYFWLICELPKELMLLLSSLTLYRLPVVLQLNVLLTAHRQSKSTLGASGHAQRFCTFSRESRCVRTKPRIQPYLSHQLDTYCLLWYVYFKGEASLLITAAPLSPYEIAFFHIFNTACIKC